MKDNNKSIKGKNTIVTTLILFFSNPHRSLSCVYHWREVGRIKSTNSCIKSTCIGCIEQYYTVFGEHIFIKQRFYREFIGCEYVHDGEYYR